MGCLWALKGLPHGARGEGRGIGWLSLGGSRDVFWTVVLGGVLSSFGDFGKLFKTWWVFNDFQILEHSGLSLGTARIRSMG